MRRKKDNALVNIVIIIAVCFIFVRFISPIISNPVGKIVKSVDTESMMQLLQGIEESMEENDGENDAEEDAAATSDVTDIYGNKADEIVIEFIDVGQGDSTLIYNVTTDTSCLIDTGRYEAYDNVQAALSEYGIKTIDVLVLTHPDADHIQSAVDVIEDYNVPVVYMSEAVNDDAKTYEHLMEYLEQYPGDVIYPKFNDSFCLGSENVKMFFYGPVEYTDLSDTNGNSLVVKLVNGNDSFLFMGDATGDETEDILLSGADVSADVIKAAHHGSANDGCNSEEFMKAVDAEYIVVSCGYQNDYGHPHIETMQLVQELNMKLYRTDLQGSVICKSVDDGIEWEKEPTDIYTNGNGLK